MGTKNKPGEFDCYENAEPDEPMFILLGRDPVAAFVVRVWIAIRIVMGNTSEEKLNEARKCAADLEAYAKLRKPEKVAYAQKLYDELIGEK